MGMVLAHDPTEFDGLRYGVIIGPDLPDNPAGPSIRNGRNVGLTAAPNDVIGMKAFIPIIILVVWTQP